MYPFTPRVFPVKLNEGGRTIRQRSMKHLQTKLSSNVWVAMLFAYLVLLIFGNALLHNNPIGGGDLHYNLSVKTIISEQLRSGNMPYWNPYSVSGVPIIADPNHGFFYPINFILSFLADQIVALNLNLVLHVFLGLFLMFQFLKKIGIGQYTAIFGAIAYGLSNVVAARIYAGHLNYLQIYSLIPALFLITEYFIGSPSFHKRLVNSTLFGLLFACMFFLGVQQVLIYVLGLWIVYLIFRLHQEGLLSSITIWMLFVFQFVFISFLISPLLLPSLSAINQSIRSQPMSNEFRFEGSIKAMNFKRLLSPNILGSPLIGEFQQGRVGVNYQESALYFGLLPFLLFLFAPVNKKRRGLAYLLWAVFFFVLWLSRGNNGALYPLLSHLPIIDRFRIPGRVLILIPFIGSVGAAIGLSLLNKVAARKKIPSYFIGIGAILLLCVDYGFVHHSLFTLSDPTIKNFQQYSVVARAIEPTPRARVLNFGFNSVRFHLEEVGGVMPLLNRNLAEYVNYLEGIDIEDYKYGGGVGAKALMTKRIFESKLRDLLNVHYGVTANNANFDRILTNIVENPNYYPRTLLSAHHIVISDKKSALDYLSSPSFDPLMQVVLSEDPPLVNPIPRTDAKILGEVRIVKYSPNKITIQSQSNVPQWLILNDLYYPEWKATVNGSIVPVFRANYIARAIALPAGTSNVVFYYDGTLVRRGIIMSGITILVMLGFNIASFVHERKK